MAHTNVGGSRQQVLGEGDHDRSSAAAPVAVEDFIRGFQDHLAPKLDVYEQAIYFYLYRHTRFLGKQQGVFGLKSERTRIACGIGEHGKPMSESTAYKKLASLDAKGAVRILQTQHTGRDIRVLLPHEIEGVIPPAADEDASVSLEDMDFFDDPRNRMLILEREGRRCFYGLEELDQTTFVVDHVVSRPRGGNGYTNVVACCRQCNNRKGSTAAADFIRRLYREGYLSQEEFTTRLQTLEDIQSGRLQPSIEVGSTAP